jgi:4-hydroxy-tetrahydrodipicolinate synthase
MKCGFYPALGTPTDSNGLLIKASYEREIELMIDAGAQGLLCMGSMGKMDTIRDAVYPDVAKTCCRIAAGRIPIMVGVMDCSVARVIDRIDALRNIEIEGVVATVPFYCKLSEKNIINFFTMLTSASKYPVFVYDLPSVTQSPITENIFDALILMPNIKGIKTANINLVLSRMRNAAVRDDFYIFYSGLDTFDAAYKAGIKYNLDGMFTCTPHNSKLMYNDHSQMSKYLNNILKLRNLMLKEDLFRAYSYLMNLLGCPGSFNPDYSSSISQNAKNELLDLMQEIGEMD